MHLKNNQLNVVLLAYLRSLLKKAYYGAKTEDVVRLTRVTDLKFELYCLEFYEQLVNHLVETYEQFSTLEHDMDLLSKPFDSYYRKMAVLFRSERKKIIRSQRTVVRFVIKLIQKTIEFHEELK